MKIYNVFKWTDFMGSFSSLEKADEYILKNEKGVKTYLYRYSIQISELDKPENDIEIKEFEGGITMYVS